MAFSTSYADIQDVELLKPGKYEVIIAEAEEIITKNGAHGIQLKAVVRNDVAQEGKNRFIFHTLWKKKEPDDKDKMVDGYSFKQIMQLAKAVQLPDGKNYKNLAEMLGDVVKKCLLLTVYHEEYNGQTSVRVRYMNPTEKPDCKHVFQPKTGTVAPSVLNIQYHEPVAITVPVGNFEELSPDDDLPF